MHQGAPILLLCVAVTVMAGGGCVCTNHEEGLLTPGSQIKTIMHLFCKYLDDTKIQ